jgi:hypothetical protein
VTSLYHGLMDAIDARSGRVSTRRIARPASKVSPLDRAPIGPGREHYLSDIARAVRDYHTEIAGKVEAVRQDDAIARVAGALEGPERDRLAARTTGAAAEVRRAWDALVAQWSGREYVYEVRGKPVRQPAVRDTLSGTPLPRVALPDFDEPGAQVRFLMKENVFPFTAGVFPFKRTAEDPTRMFAGEGGPANARTAASTTCPFGQPYKRPVDRVRLASRCTGETRPSAPTSTARSATPASRSARSTTCEELYSGFDLCDPTTSVSMTINGPAPMLLAMFLNTAIDQQSTGSERQGRRRDRAAPPPEDAAPRQLGVTGDRGAGGGLRPQNAVPARHRAGRHPEGRPGPEHLHLLDRVRAAHDGRRAGVLRPPTRCATSTRCRSPATTSPKPARTRSASSRSRCERVHLRRVLPVARDARRRVRAEPELLLQQRHRPRVHGDRPCRASHLGRGDARPLRRATSAARSSSTTSRRPVGRCTRRRSTSTTSARRCRRCYAIYDNCNSLHTNAYDEAITTPTEESVRRAMAIQLIINKELGLAKNENPLQGSFLVEELTDLVEEAVLRRVRAPLRAGRRARRDGD